MPGTRFSIEVQPKIPEELARIEELANNLIYSWDRQVRGLFFRLDRGLWDETNHNPKLFLRHIDQRKLEAAAKDPVYMQDFQRVINTYDSYLKGVIHPGIKDFVNGDGELVSYSCAEFGLHESFPIYSGGLGILAGDHCKAASDMGLPFVAVGMLYRQGYFNQRIDGHGNQLAVYTPSQFSDLPISKVLDDHGEQMHVHIDVPGRKIYLRVWMADVGHIRLYLMDSDIETNNEDDRRITYQLYGGDSTNRLLQEMILGIGGVRVKRKLGLNPTIWHVNEGHAAFQIIERCRELVEKGLDFDSALEMVAANTVFTTHTPVPAGHDIFSHDLIRHYFSEFVRELKVDIERFIELGNSPANPHGFNMTALALRGSRFHNGVSRIHGGVASEMERYIWPDIQPAENPIRYVTNGVHVPTFLASEWANHFDLTFGGRWRFELLNKKYWRQIKDIPNHSFWSIRKSLKTKMLETVCEKAIDQYRRNGFSESQIRRMTRFLNPRLTDIFTIGFARRFATYKRATLIFSDIERVRRILGDDHKPVVLIFAGKAHPHDQPGQDLIRKIWQYSLMPEFQGKIILLENFDIALARKLVTGVDVWLNNPAYPLEASGTSGQKAGINGVLNLSVLDGWWDEGYNGENGWAITPHGEQYSPEFRDQEEARELLDVLENEAIPLYYERDGQGYSAGWIEKCKNAMASLIPQFNAQRMLSDYVNNFYLPAAKLGRQLSENDYENARLLAGWKQKVRKVWSKVTIQRLDEPMHRIYRDQTFQVRLAIDLAGLDPQDVAVDLLMGRVLTEGEFHRHDCASLHFVEMMEDGRALFSLSMALTESGKLCYMVRVYPYHELLGQRFETGFMKWI